MKRTRFLAGMRYFSFRCADLRNPGRRVFDEDSGYLSEAFTHAEAQKFFAKRVGELTKGKAEVKVFPEMRFGK